MDEQQANKQPTLEVSGAHDSPGEKSSELSNNVDFVSHVMRYLDGVSTAEETAALIRVLNSNEESRAVFVEICRFSWDINEKLSPGEFATRLKNSGISESHDVDQVLAECVSALPISSSSPVPQLPQAAREQFPEAAGSQTTGRQTTDRQTTGRCSKTRPNFSRSWNKRRLAALASIAAMILLAVTLIATNNQGIGVIKRSALATWGENGGPVAPGSRVEPGQRTLLEGQVEFELDEGANLTVIAPAKFILNESGGVYLTHGHVTASVHKGVDGFTIQTSQLNIVDRGTAFGVYVKDKHTQEVHVLDGLVDVSAVKASGNSSFRPAVNVRRGEAVLFSSAKEILSIIDFDQERFDCDWNGVLKLAPAYADQNIKYREQLPRELSLGKLKSSKHLFLFLESEEVVLEEDVPLDVLYSGAYESQEVPRNGQGSVSAGSRITSYLVHFNPDKKNVRGQPPRRSRMRSRVAFQRPILGIIGSDRLLKATDALLGDPATKYMKSNMPGMRGIFGENENDSFEISEDRMTLSLDLNALTAMDELRVIVEAPNY